MLPWDKDRLEDFERRFRIIEFQTKKAVEYFNSQWANIEWDGDMNSYERIYTEMANAGGKNMDLVNEKEFHLFVQNNCNYYCAEVLGRLDEVKKETDPSKKKDVLLAIQGEYSKKILNPLLQATNQQDLIGQAAERFKKLAVQLSGYTEYMSNKTDTFNMTYNAQITKAGEDMIALVESLNFTNTYYVWPDLVTRLYRGSNKPVFMEGWGRNELNVFSDPWFSLFYCYSNCSRIVKLFKDVINNGDQSASGLLLKCIKNEIASTERPVFGYLVVHPKSQALVITWLKDAVNKAALSDGELATELFCSIITNMPEKPEGVALTTSHFESAFGRSTGLTHRLDLSSCFAFMYMLRKLPVLTTNSLKQIFYNDVYHKATAIIDTVYSSDEEREYNNKFPMFETDLATKAAKNDTNLKTIQAREESAARLEIATKAAIDRKEEVIKRNTELEDIDKGDAAEKQAKAAEKKAGAAFLQAAMLKKMAAAPTGPVQPATVATRPVYKKVTPDIQAFFDELYDKEQAAKAALKAQAAAKAAPQPAAAQTAGAAASSTAPRKKNKSVLGRYNPNSPTIPTGAANTVTQQKARVAPVLNPVVKNMAKKVNTRKPAAGVITPPLHQIINARDTFKRVENGDPVQLKDQIEAAKVFFQKQNTDPTFRLPGAPAPPTSKRQRTDSI